MYNPLSTNIILNQQWLFKSPQKNHQPRGFWTPKSISSPASRGISSRRHGQGHVVDLHAWPTSTIPFFWGGDGVWHIYLNIFRWYSINDIYSIIGVKLASQLVISWICCIQLEGDISLGPFPPIEPQPFHRLQCGILLGWNQNFLERRTSHNKSWEPERVT